MIQISFKNQDSSIKTGTIQNPRQTSQLIHDPLCFQNPRIRSVYHKNPQSGRILRPNPSIRKPIHPFLDHNFLSDCPINVIKPLSNNNTSSACWFHCWKIKGLTSRRLTSLAHAISSLEDYPLALLECYE